MENLKYEQVVRFVKDFFESHDPIGTELITRFPFRRRFDHCLRCSVWAHRIALNEGADVKVSEISALFHDIGKSIDKAGQSHGEVGAQICEDYLTSKEYDKDRCAKIVRIVRNHSSHATENDSSLEEKVVSDADLLDEVGAITVLWDAMACAGENDPSYEKAYETIVTAYDKLKELLYRLHTPTAKRIFEERLLFLSTYLKNLNYELGRSESVYETS